MHFQFIINSSKTVQFLLKKWQNHKSSWTSDSNKWYPPGYADILRQNCTLLRMTLRAPRRLRTRPNLASCTLSIMQTEKKWFASQQSQASHQQWRRNVPTRHQFQKKHTRPPRVGGHTMSKTSIRCPNVQVTRCAHANLRFKITFTSAHEKYRGKGKGHVIYEEKNTNCQSFQRIQWRMS